MKTLLVESGSGSQRTYDSLMLESKHLGIFSSELAISVINELAKQPLCAMDIAKKLKQNEQKIYYHLRKMKDAGIVKLNGTEQRYGMTAKIFELVSPVISTKLYDKGYDTKNTTSVQDPALEEFLKPFIINKKLNAEIIIGSPKINSITDRINDELPIYFDMKKEWIITSKLTKNTYNYDHDAIIVRVKNPFDKSKEIILLAGRRSQGLRSAMLAFTRHTSDIMKGNVENEKMIAKVVRGVDKDGDGVIDSVTFLE